MNIEDKWADTLFGRQCYWLICLPQMYQMTHSMNMKMQSASKIVFHFRVAVMIRKDNVHNIQIVHYELDSHFAIIFVGG